MDYMELGHGWLPKDDTLPYIIEGVYVDPATRTRREEYHWCAARLAEAPGLTLLDAATGYVPTWHVLPYIAATLGYSVTTVDLDERTMAMAPHRSVRRGIGDIRAMPFPDGAFDIVACISTLEHLSEDDQWRAAAELCRVARCYVIVTADEAPWLVDRFRGLLDIGEEQVFSADATHLSPRVYAIAGAVL